MKFFKDLRKILLQRSRYTMHLLGIRIVGLHDIYHVFITKKYFFDIVAEITFIICLPFTSLIIPRICSFECFIYDFDN
uniref:Uncharacterized protein n=1 Tax=Heterorhabditis bacteriophora TaxID=37862 RepID=A0A1I7WGY7_HETBA